MRDGETTLACCVCREPATCCEVSSGTGFGPLCWTCSLRRKFEAGVRIEQIVRCEAQGIGRLDRGRGPGGDVVCEACGKKYYDHPQEAEHRFLNVLCDGSVVKL